MTTTTTTSVPLPAGAVSTEEWQPDTSSHYRNFQGEIREVVAGARYGAHAVAVYAHAVQHDDGRIDDGPDPVFEAPGISMLTIDDEDGRPTDIGLTLTSTAARSLADVLVTAADEVGTMTATTTPNAPIPAGADWVEDWEGEGEGLGRLFHHPTIENGETILHIIGVQYANGSTSRSVRVRVVDGLYEADFTPARLREFAAALLKLADTCEILDGVDGDD